PTGCFTDFRAGISRRLREFHREAAGPQVTPELLAKQRLHIRLVVHDQNEQSHVGSPDLPAPAARRGSPIRTSVNSPGWVSTSMVPACCFTMMSWLMDRPSPVPSPAGLVVKNGLKILSLTSAGMPMPLSRMLISTRSPRLRVTAVSLGSKPSPTSSLRLVAA